MEKTSWDSEVVQGFHPKPLAVSTLRPVHKEDAPMQQMQRHRYLSAITICKTMLLSRQKLLKNLDPTVEVETDYYLMYVMNSDEVEAAYPRYAWLEHLIYDADFDETRSSSHPYQSTFVLAFLPGNRCGGRPCPK